ncbi:MAG: hypothetical protein RLZZ501_799 [Pseudomonadota bacterium]|jgi:hypothetical protein
MTGPSLIRRLTLALLLAGGLAGPAAALDKPRDFNPPMPEQVPNFRAQTRDVLIELASYAKKRDPHFQILLRNGVELLAKGDWEEQWDALHDPAGTNFYRRLPPRAVYRPLVKLLDGLVIDGLYCGKRAFDQPLDAALKARRADDAVIDRDKKLGVIRPPLPTEMGPFSNDPAVELRRAAEIQEKIERIERQRRILYAVDAMRAENRVLLSVESCAGPAATAALRAGARDHVVPYVTASGRLDEGPKTHPPGENSAEATSLGAVRAWLPLLRSDRFGDKGAFVDAVAGDNDDLVVIDVAQRAQGLTKDDLTRMKFKKMGPRRMVFAVLPIGRAYDWRWYWQKGWEVGNPAYLFAHDAAPGSYIVDLANGEWKALLGKYLTAVMDLGFDGVLFDDADTYLWFEELMPIDH